MSDIRICKALLRNQLHVCLLREGDLWMSLKLLGEGPWVGMGSPFLPTSPPHLHVCSTLGRWNGQKRAAFLLGEWILNLSLNQTHQGLQIPRTQSQVLWFSSNGTLTLTFTLSWDGDLDIFQVCSRSTLHLSYPALCPGNLSNMDYLNGFPCPLDSESSQWEPLQEMNGQKL